MAKKQYFLILGNNISGNDSIANFGAIVVDRKGNIYEEYPTQVKGHMGTSVMSVQAINHWLESVHMTFKPSLTAYNLEVELDKLTKSGINLSQYTDRFCLWRLAARHFAETKAYRRFVLDIRAFTDPSKFGNMVYRTDAPVMAAFVQGKPDISNMQEAALEDCKALELPILVAVLKRPKWREAVVRFCVNCAC